MLSAILVLAAPRVLHLDEASQRALRQQPAVLAAQAQREAAAGRAMQARSTLLPQVTAIASYQRIHGAARSGTTTTTTGGGATTPATGTAPGATGGTTVTGTGTFDLWNFGGSASQLIWDFGQGYERWRAADRLVDAQRANERTTAAQVLLGVRRAYFQARAQRALIVVTKETLENLEKHTQQIEGFVATGTRPEIDVAQARTDAANARVQLINAQGAYDLARVQLAQAMGDRGESATDFDVADDALGPVRGEDGPTDALVAAAIGSRPELAALERQGESEEMTVRSYKGGYGPTLSASGGAFETGTSLDQLGPTWNVGATLAWPLFQGGLTTGLVHEAKANLDATRAQLEAERLQVRSDVEQSVLSLRAAKATVDASQEALTNSRERLRLAEGRYQSGVGSVIELGDAQVAYTNAAAQAVQAELSVSSARAQLLAAMGAR